MKVAIFIFSGGCLADFSQNGVEMAYKWRTFGVYVSKNSCNFAAEFETYKMFELLSIGATAAAWANYRKAKAAYEAACQEDDTAAILAAISQYENTKYDQLDKVDKDEYVPTESTDFLVVPVLNCGMMVGNYCRAQYSVIIKNLSDYDYELRHFDITVKLYGVEVAGLGDMRATIKAHSEQNYTWVSNHAKAGKDAYWADLENQIRTSLSDMEVMSEPFIKAKEAVLVANQRKLITSCAVPTYVVGNPPAVTADVFFECISNRSGDQGGAVSYKNIKGTFAYRGEAYYPGGK